MGTPLRKTRLVANDAPRTVAYVPPLLMPVQPVLPASRVIPHVRLAPMPARRDLSWAAIVAAFLLGATIFLLGAVAGTVFWFTYDLENVAAPVSKSAVMARFAEAPQVVQTLPIKPQALATANIAPVSPPTKSEADTQIVLRESRVEATDDLMDRAQTYLGQGNNDAALVLCERVLAAEPGNRAALEAKAYALGRSEHKAALQELKRIADGAPDNAAVQAAFAKTLARQGETKDAIARLDHAVRLAPGDIEARFDLAVLYDRAGERPEALALYRQILQLAGNGKAPLSAATLDAVRLRYDYLAGIGEQE